MKDSIMVSISCITYNHEDYLAEALDSFVIQKTTFKFEILIHDDASTDRTAAIIREYEKKYPDLIFPVYQTDNKYSQGYDVEEFNTERARGKYIALCEGDDYWTDPYKLQKQVDYMELHPECSMCVHAAYVVNVEGKKRKNIRPSIGNRIFTIEEVIEGGGGLFATNSIIYPSSLDKNKPDFYKNAPVGDYPLAIYLALQGTVYYIDAFMSVYRKGVNGSWTSTQLSSIEKIIRHVQNTEKMLDEINQFTEYKYDTAIRNKKAINKFKILIAQENFAELKKNEFLPIYKSLKLKEKAKILLKKYFPRSVRLFKKIRKKYRNICKIE